MNAKNAPIAKMPTDSQYSRSEARRVEVHKAASAGSSGQGRLRARHCNRPDASNMIPATPNTGPLWSENQTSCGTADTSDDKAAPAPIDTSSAGSAQQIKVLPLVNSDSMEA